MRFPTGRVSGRGQDNCRAWTGIDVIYPPENKKLFQEIQESGAVVSEFAMGTEPHAVNFRRRNRIISAFRLACL